MQWSWKSALVKQANTGLSYLWCTYIPYLTNIVILSETRVHTPSISKFTCQFLKVRSQSKRTYTVYEHLCCKSGSSLAVGETMTWNAAFCLHVTCRNNINENWPPLAPIVSLHCGLHFWSQHLKHGPLFYDGWMGSVTFVTGVQQPVMGVDVDSSSSLVLYVSWSSTSWVLVFLKSCLILVQVKPDIIKSAFSWHFLARIHLS